MEPKTVEGVNRFSEKSLRKMLALSFPSRNVFQNRMKTVAVIGASNDRSKFGNKAVRAFQQTGHTVYPVHPAQTVIEGLTCYKTIGDVPERPNLVSVYVGPDRLLQILPDIAARGCDELWLNPGTVSREVLTKAKELGLKPVELCSILAIGMSPNEL
jgi:predicted CoA-binding protein